jgi:hypothetical protein
MKTTLNKKMRNFVENGSYIERKYYETTEQLQARMSKNDYHYSIRCNDDILSFTTKNTTIEIPKKDFDWRMLWDKLGNVPTNDDEIETDFEHFPIGSQTTEIWQWFEWFFDISLGKELYC